MAELLPVLDTRYAAKNRRVAWLGDSRIAQDAAIFSGRSGIKGQNSNGVASWLRFLCRQTFDSGSALNYGVSSETTTQILARTDALLAATDAGVIVVLAGTNDRPNAMTADTTIANLTAIRQKIVDAGRAAVFVAEMPRGNAAFPAQRLIAANGYANQLPQHMRVRRAIIAMRGLPNTYVADVWGAMALASSTDGDILATMARDGLHESVLGAYTIALALKPIFDQLYIARPDRLPASNADLFDATYALEGSLNSNPMLTGSTALSGTGLSGNGPTGVTIDAPPSGVTAAYSKVTDANGKEWTQIVLGGSTTAATVNSWRLMHTFPNVSQGATGDTLEAWADIEIDAGSSGLLSVRPGIQEQAGAFRYFDDLFPNTDFPADYFPGVALKGVMRSAPCVLPSAGSRLALQATVYTGVTVSATIRVGCLTARKLIP